MKQLYLLIVLLTFTHAFSQESIVLQGKVTNEKDVEGIHILNTSSRYNSVTDLYGNFAITVKRADTLVFSSVHYAPKKVAVTPEIFEKSLVVVTLEPLINELDEVMLGPNLTGDLKTDIEKIPVEDPKNFKDFGLPGFEGVPEERIVPLASAITITRVDIEAIYKHLSGYYRKLRLRRKWDAENVIVANLLIDYPSGFLQESFAIPESRSYDFILFCVESTSIAQHYRTRNYAEVISIFSTQSKVYLQRMESKEE